MRGRQPKSTLREKYPDIDTDWCFERNGSLTPDSVGSRSGKIVWWSCPNNQSHEHQARVFDKTLTFDRWQKWGCPFCSGRRIGSPKEGQRNLVIPARCKAGDVRCLNNAQAKLDICLKEMQ